MIYPALLRDDLSIVNELEKPRDFSEVERRQLIGLFRKLTPTSRINVNPLSLRQVRS